MPKVSESAWDAGHGPGTIVFVHGSATDHSTWIYQRAELSKQFRVYAQARNMAERGGRMPTMADYGADLRHVIDSTGDDVVLVGSSLGAIVAMQCLDHDSVHGLVASEPPMTAHPWIPTVPHHFACHFEQLVAAGQGPRAAEFFLRTVLSDRDYELIPVKWRESLLTRWPEIRCDMRALHSFRVDHVWMRQQRKPVLLVSGGRSPAYYEDTLETLELLLPNAERATIGRAGHMMHLQAHRQYNQLVASFCNKIFAQLGLRAC